VHILIRHETRYDFDRAVDHTTQLLRLTPQNHTGQIVVRWRVSCGQERALTRCDDGYGNVVHLVSRNERHTFTTAIAEGEVETSDTNGIVRGAVERLPPIYFLRTTPATTPDAAILALARSMPSEPDTVSRLHRLMLTIRHRVDYEVGATTATTSAADALATARGVCQDHAHIFLAAARSIGVPARYVSGYLAGGGRREPEDAGHAWAEAYVEDLGWVGFDVANRICPTEAYVRVAIGLDAQEAAPIRGVRRGPVDESLKVALHVTRVGDQ
jgi:transglutaminase-like putative cysteine protease